jgi:polysaccharide biosynthesis protein PslH
MAMAMQRPVVAASTCVRAIEAQEGRDLVAADSANQYVAAIDELLRDKAKAQGMGLAARDCVLRGYAWTARLAPLDAELRPA